MRHSICQRILQEKDKSSLSRWHRSGGKLLSRKGHADSSDVVRAYSGVVESGETLQKAVAAEEPAGRVFGS